MSEFRWGPAPLFCPADRPERYAKALERSDGVIIDLEDAVAPEAKPAAREALRASALDPARVIVRVNPVDSGEFQADLDALRATPYRAVMLAKTESAAQCEALAGYDVIGLCETALGVVRAEEIAAAPNVVGVMWGAEDLVASLGGTSSRRADQAYRDLPTYARARVALAAGAFGKAALDAVHFDITDLDGLRAEAEDAVALGYAATVCIHPSQVPVVRAAYAPTAEEIAWARRILDAAAAAGTGVFAFDGHMVDGPVLRHARSIIARTPAQEPTGSKETP